MLYIRDYFISKVYFTPFTVQNLRMHLIKIDQACFGYLATSGRLSDLLTIGQKNTMASLKTKLIRLYMKQLLKLRKDKQNGALQYLMVNKLRKDVGVSI